MCPPYVHGAQLSSLVGTAMGVGSTESMDPNAGKGCSRQNTAVL